MPAAADAAEGVPRGSRARNSVRGLRVLREGGGRSDPVAHPGRGRSIRPCPHVSPLEIVFRRPALAHLRRDAVMGAASRGTHGSSTWKPALRCGGGSRLRRDPRIGGAGLSRELPGRRVDDSGLKIGMVRARTALGARRATSSQPGDHLFPRRRVRATRGGGARGRCVPAARARGAAAAGGSSCVHMSGFHHVDRASPLRPPRARRCAATCRTAARGRRRDADEDLQRDAHREHRRLDVARVQGLECRGASRRHTVAKHCARRPLGALAELCRGVVAVEGRRPRPMSISACRRSWADRSRRNLVTSRSRRAAEARLRRHAHSWSARDDARSAALSGPGAALCGDDRDG